MGFLESWNVMNCYCRIM